MHLKTLTIKGFKSFASSTTLRLEPGITAVVGPNGSGKSNVVDALTWVMGEQGAKNRRGGSMADVIFAGAGSRPALGRAEVSLTIDNSDGVLPIDYTEVTVTRTLFRGGGSEYQINGTPCRLLDVQELLSDTGLGRQMHVIVGQGRLDAVLQATPEERRGFIEEAAGVLKHRRRKERALRKLDSMAADLARLTDLTAELRRQLGPLARQAAVARRARTIQVEVRDATARLLADEVVQTQALLEAGDEDQATLARRRSEAEEAERVARARLAELAGAEATSGQRLSRATATWEELTAAAQSFSALADVAAERVRGLASAPPASFGTDPEELERRARAVEALARRQADRREKLARAGGAVASARSRHEAALAAREQARTALAQAVDREQAAQAALEEARPSGHDAGAGAASIQETEGPAAGSAQEQAAADHEAASAALAAARDAVSAANEARREAASDRATWTARRDTLALSLSAQDSTAQLADSGLPGVLGPLAEQLVIERGWENAVAALLGEAATAAVMVDDDAATRALVHARGADSSSLRLVVASSHGLDSPTEERPEEAGYPGAHRALSLVCARGQDLTALLDHLLAGSWVVADLEAAASLREAVPHAVVATRDGEVLAPGRASAQGRGTSSVLELAAAHEEAAAEARAAGEAESQAEAALEQARSSEEEARHRVSQALAALRAADAEAAREAETLARLGSAVRAAKEETGRARRVLERAEAESAGRTTELASATAALSQLEGEEDDGPEDLDSRLEAARAEREQAAAAAREARSAETEARLALRTAEERERSGRGRADSLRAAARREREARAAAERAGRRRAAALAVASHVRDQARAAQQSAATWAAQAQEERHGLEAERSRSAQATAQVREEIDQATRLIAQLTDAAHRDEIARAEQRVRLEALADRAMSELGMELEPLVEEYGPHMPVPDLQADEQDEQPEDEDGQPPARAGRPYVRAEQEKRLARASRDLARLGKVNPLALEEHAALEQRHQFLAEQLADLTRSRSDLLRIVEEIDARVLEVFTSAWQDTAREFELDFDRLFPGGQGRLVLTDPSDMLTTGIEIEARPAGKKVTRLSLLSGGERSLAAVALLIAIFKARPSPFYVMDEVEAALDDTNLGRLLEIFTELRRDSQLIIITHQKRTMEVADALYGITMREGVTQVVSQRLARPEDTRS